MQHRLHWMGQGSVELPSYVSIVNHDDLIDGGLKKEDTVRKVGSNYWHIDETEAKVLDKIIKDVVQRGATVSVTRS